LLNELTKLQKTVTETEEYGRVGRHLPGKRMKNSIKGLHNRFFKDSNQHVFRVQLLEDKIAKIKELIDYINTNDYNSLYNAIKKDPETLDSTSFIRSSSSHKKMKASVDKLTIILKQIDETDKKIKREESTISEKNQERKKIVEDNRIKRETPGP
jgi:hypothetical protein